MTSLQIFFCVFAALSAGFVDAIAGGGGVIVIPVLFICDLPANLVLGTNKLVGTCGTLVATWSFSRGKKLNPELLYPAIPFTIIGAAIGAMSVTLIPPDRLKPLAIGLTFLLAAYFFFRPQIGLEGSYDKSDRRLRIIVCAAALILGFYDGLFGPGTGAFLTFVFVRLIGLDFLSAAANTKVLNVTSNIVALLLFLWKGNVLFALGLPMAAANMIGGWLGAHVAIRKGSSWVRWIYIVMALVLAAKLALF